MQLRTEHIYREFLRLTRRLSNSQIMMLLAVVVGILAGLGTYLFEILLHGIKSGLIRWFPVDSAHFLLLIYPAVGIILATLKGTGTVWVQSLPFSRLAERIYDATFKAREEVRAGGK